MPSVALDMLVKAALGDQAEGMDSAAECEIGEEAGKATPLPLLGHESDPGSASVTDLAPGLQPVLAQRVAGPQDRTRGALAGAGEGQERGSGGVSVSGGRKQSYTGADVHSDEALATAAAAAAAAASPGCGGLGGPVVQPQSGPMQLQGAAALLQAALPDLLSALQVVQALRAQGICGPKFDGMEAAVGKVQAACSCLAQAL